MSIENLNGGDAFYPTAFNKLNQTIDVANSLSSATANIVSLSSELHSLTAGITANEATFNTSYTPTSYFAGHVYWDADNHTLAIQTGIDAVTLQSGQELFFLGVNKTDDVISNGCPVYISGAQGNRPQIFPSSSSSVTTARICGITTMDIPVNQVGFCTVNGVVNEVNTNSWTAGTFLYTSATGGVFTSNTYDTQYQNCAGIVLYSHSNQGKILCKPQTGFSLEQLHKVSVSGAHHGDMLVHDSNLSIWKKSSSIGISGSASANGGFLTSTSSYFYFGDPDVDGTWRFGVSGNNFIHQRRESSVWVTKDTITP
jgi:hypothetical protein